MNGAPGFVHGWELGSVLGSELGSVLACWSWWRIRSRSSAVALRVKVMARTFFGVVNFGLVGEQLEETLHEEAGLAGAGGSFDDPGGSDVEGLFALAVVGGAKVRFLGIGGDGKRRTLSITGGLWHWQPRASRGLLQRARGRARRDGR